MIKRIKLSFEEIINRILWLQAEIDLCLQYDLPIEHLEKELSEIDTIPEDVYVLTDKSND